jgi:hypothetical protein
MIRRGALLATLLAILATGPGGAEPQTFRLRPIVLMGQAAPGGGRFEHVSVEAQPVLAPVNGRGQVAFFATLLRGTGGEGLFVTAGNRIRKIAVEGDPAPAGGTLSGFAKHPVPAINDTGTVAFAAAVTGGRTVEGVFIATGGGLRAIALAGEAAPGVPAGTLAAVDVPALSNRGDVAFLATVRRGRDSLEAIYLRTGGRLRKVVLQGDPAPAGGDLWGLRRTGSERSGQRIPSYTRRSEPIPGSPRCAGIATRIVRTRLKSSVSALFSDWLR